MASFGTFATARRQPAVPLRPVLDPAGWEPEELLATDDWIYRFTESDLAELEAAIDKAQKNAVPIVTLRREDFPLPRLSSILHDVRSELLFGRGITVLRGLPVGDMGRERAAMAYFGMGLHIGKPNSQNAHGHLLGHVRDFGRSYKDPNFRGYQSNATMSFHCDHSDFVGLLCMQPAKSGGESRVASAVTLHNRMLAERPDIVEALTHEYYWTRHGEVPPGKKAWKKQPIFGFAEGYFSARGASNYIHKAQALPDVPRMTPLDFEALDLYQKMVGECAADIAFERGDIQLLHNNVMQHSRREFSDWPEPERKRHLYRLWLSAGVNARPIPEEMRENFQGIYVAGYKPRIVIDPELAEEAMVS